MTGYTRIPGQNFQGGSGAADLSRTLSDAELGVIANNTDQIVDAFNQERGTKVNLLISNSELSIVPGQNSGSYERKKQTSTLIKNVEGETIVTAQLFAPTNNGITGNTVVFGGDLSGLFASGSKTIIFRETESDDQTTSVALLDGDKVAILDVDTVTYDDVADETTILLLNPNNLDIKNGVSDANLFEQLRFMRLFIQPQANADDASYENLVLKSLYNTDILRLQGESLAKAISTQTAGSSTDVAVKFSPNKQYAVARVIYRAPADVDFYFDFYYTTDRGNTWSKFAFSDTYNATPTVDGSRAWAPTIANANQLAVADNGKCLITYPRNRVVEAGGIEGWGVIGDLSTTTPTLTRTPDRGNGPGALFWNSTLSYSFIVAGNSDHSRVAVVYQSTANGLGAIWLDSFGNLVYGITETGSQQFSYGMAAVVVDNGGGSGLDRLFVLTTDTSVNMQCWYNDYGIANTLWGLLTNEGNGLAQGNTYVGSIAYAQNKLHVGIRDESNLDFRYQYLDNSNPSAVAWSPEFKLNDLRTSMSMDVTSEQVANHLFTNDRKLVVNPNNGNHVFIVEDFNNDGTIETQLYEIKDVTSLSSPLVVFENNTTANSTATSTSITKLGQTLNFPTQVELKTLAIHLANFWDGVSSVKPIWEDPNASLEINLYKGSLGDTSTLIKNWSLSHEEINNLLLNNNSAWVFLNLTESAQGDYWFEVFPNSSEPTDHLVVYRTNTGVDSIAGGTGATFNGSTWNAENYDLSILVIKDVWVSQPFRELRSRINGAQRTDVSRGQLGFVDNNQLLLSASRFPVDTVQGKAWYSEFRGHPWGRIISISQNLQQSVSSDLKALSGATDKNIVFNVSLGDPKYDFKSPYTGISPDAPLVNRAIYEAGFGVGVDQTFGVGSSNFVTDSNFQSGFAMQFVRASTNYVAYENTQHHWLSWWQPFSIEAEIDLATNPGGSGEAGVEARTIISKYRQGAPAASLGQGWIFWIDGDGYLEFRTNEGNDIITTSRGAKASDKVEPLGYHKVKVVYDPRVDFRMRLYRDEGAGWVEVASYLRQSDYNGIALQPGDVRLYVGALSDNSSTAGDQPDRWFDGKIGYIKFINGGAQFAYNGFRDQTPFIEHVNCGHMVVGDSISGRDNTSSAQYGQSSYARSNPKISRVDSRDQRLIWEKTLANAGQNTNLLVNYSRVSEEDQSRTQGLVFQFKK